MDVIGIGVDLVHVPSIADQLSMPGTRFADAFTPGERRDAHQRQGEPADHLAARWAAKEAVIKAWSASVYASPPVTSENVYGEIEVVCDAWGRPAIRVHGSVAAHTPHAAFHVSLSHDHDYAIAYALMLAVAPDER